VGVDERKPTGAEVTIGKDPDAVPRARQFVRSSLEGEARDLVSDAELVVTELVTNAALHGEPPIVVRLIQIGSSVRLEVEDAGRTLPVQGAERNDAMTGRGLALVAATASSWGVAPARNGGKVVWADLPSSIDGRGTPGPSAADLDRVQQGWDDRLAERTYRVVLPKVPTDFLLAAKAQIDNVVRELTLLRQGEAASGVALPAEMDDLIRTVTVDFAWARTEMKREAALAAERGEAMTDLVLQLPLSAADTADRYLAALEQADRYARAAHLLTLAAPRSHRIFRQWYLQSIVEQLRSAASGIDPVPEPRPFTLALAAEVDRLPRLEAASVRLGVLQRVSSGLPDCRSAGEMATVAVDNLARLTGVDSAAVYLLSGRGLLEPVAWRGPDPPVAAVGLDADQPLALVARNERPLFMQSLRQIHDQFPEMAGRLVGERSLHIIPLMAGERCVGVLSLTFLGGALADDTQAGFVSAVADILAQNIRIAKWAE
jgi:hypothetical protein